MCEHGNTITLQLRGKPKAVLHPIAIDSCIVPRIKALQDAGIVTCGSCCGHGKWAGHIIYFDGSVDILWSSGSETIDRYKTFIEKRSRWWSEYERNKHNPEFIDYGKQLEKGGWGFEGTPKWRASLIPLILLGLLVKDVKFNRRGFLKCFGLDG